MNHSPALMVRQHEFRLNYDCEAINLEILTKLHASVEDGCNGFQVNINSKVLCQKHAPKAGTSNYTPWILWNVIAVLGTLNKTIDRWVWIIESKTRSFFLGWKLPPASLLTSSLQLSHKRHLQSLYWSRPEQKNWHMDAPLWKIIVWRFKIHRNLFLMVQLTITRY